MALGIRSPAKAVRSEAGRPTRLRNAEPNAYNRIVVDGPEARIEARLWTGSRFASAARPGVEEAARAAG